MANSVYTVFGGTGFLGRRIVRALLEDGARVRIAARHPEIPGNLSADAKSRAETVTADIRDAASIGRAVAGAHGVANAVSLYEEHGALTFEEVHVRGAQRIAEAASASGAALVQISGIGADRDSRSAYIRARGLGEDAARAAHEGTVVLRPSVMFGPDDSFINTLADLVRRLPVIPLFGDGGTRLQPAFVGDVGQAAAKILRGEGGAPMYELGGPDIVTYRQILELVMDRAGRKRWTIPVPFAAWRAMALAGRALPSAPLTLGQVELMEHDNVVAPHSPGFHDLGIEPTPLDRVLPDYRAFA